MNLHVSGKGPNSVEEHVVYHSAHERDHEDHGPHTDNDRRKHDRGPTEVSPEISPGESKHDCQCAHQATLIACTGCNQWRRAAGYTAAKRLATNTIAGPAKIEMAFRSG